MGLQKRAVKAATINWRKLGTCLLLLKHKLSCSRDFLYQTFIHSSIPNIHHKDTLWRLSVQGLSGGRGHDICPRGPCPCGWIPPQLSAVERASALRSHAFWHCPVATAVLSQVHLGLPPMVTLPQWHARMAPTRPPPSACPSW